MHSTMEVEYLYERMKLRNNSFSNLIFNLWITFAYIYIYIFDFVLVVCPLQYLDITCQKNNKKFNITISYFGKKGQVGV